MPRRSTSYSQTDLTRLIKAAMAAGFGKEQIAEIKLTSDGPMLVLGVENAPTRTEDQAISPLDKWRANRDAH